jgi:hypothetical protein
MKPDAEPQTGLLLGRIEPIENAGQPDDQFAGTALLVHVSCAIKAG